MSRHEIGPVVLLIAERAVRTVDVVDFGGVQQSAQEVPAVVAGPDGLLLELACWRWDDSGQVVCLSRGDSSPAYDRLLHGGRLGLQAREDGTDSCEVGLLRWDASGRWGNVGKAEVEELDELVGGSADALLIESGALSFGTREDVLGDTGKRRRYLTAIYPAAEPTTPLVVYALTRVLPILAASGSAET